MPASAFLTVTPGTVVLAGGRRFLITHLLGIDSVLARDLDTEAIERLRVDQLRSEIDKNAGDIVSEGRDLDAICDEEWQEAQRRFQAIQPLLKNNQRTRADAEKIAQQVGVHVATIYKWLKLYLDAGHLSALIANPRGCKPGFKRLGKEVEKIIESVTNEMYLTKQRHTPQEVVDEVRRLCHQANIAAPHPNTIRNRLRELPLSMILRRRGFRDKARSMYSPHRGHFPGADFPLAVVQIDHTEADIIVVDEQTRQPMGRPWLTLAIDVFSRVVVGVYVSMEKPSAVSVGQCVSNAILPKNEYLALLDLPGEWPVWGRMRSIHVDNAKEFRGAMLQRACEQYTIDLQLRPVKVPHYGGHIERLMGTTATELKKLPGATFSNTMERKGYDSEKTSALTLREFEQHLVEFIVSVYHQRLHGDLNTTPIRKWELGILGDVTQPGIGIPDLPNDTKRIQLDFMPLIERTVQPYGIVVDEIYYYHEALNRWINALDPNNSKQKRKFIIRRDPRDISRVYFYDPNVESYYAIPYRDSTHPPISVWELREAQRQLKAEGRQHIDEHIIFEAIGRMRKRVEEAVTKTKAARRQMHRRKTTEKLAKTTPVHSAENLPSNIVNTPKIERFDAEDIFAETIEPFDDIKVHT